MGFFGMPLMIPIIDDGRLGVIRADDGDDDDDDDDDGVCIGVMRFCSFAIAIGDDELLCIGMLEDTKDMVADDIIMMIE